MKKIMNTMLLLFALSSNVIVANGHQLLKSIKVALKVTQAHASSFSFITSKQINQNTSSQLSDDFLKQCMKTMIKETEKLNNGHCANYPDRVTSALSFVSEDKLKEIYLKSMEEYNLDKK